MKTGKSQLVAIILSAVIAFTFGFGGGIAWDYVKTNRLLPDSVIGAVSGDEAVKTVQSQEVTGAVSSDSSSDKSVPELTQSGDITINVSEDTTISEAIAAKALPSVVGITTTYEYTYSSYGSGYGYFFGFGGGYSTPQTQEAQGVGTGVIVDESGYILTNAHVINDGDYTRIDVSLYDGSTVDGTVLWYDTSLDLAIVKIEAKGLTAAELGDSDTIQIGSYAAAIGNPLGLAFERSMSQGIISGLNRSITVSDSSTGSSNTMDNLIQTDATINSGNSGGPLFNSKGQVIGINTAKASSGEGMGFAIPINTAKPIIEQVKATGTFTRAYIGITGYDLSTQSSMTEDQLMESFGTTSGVYVYTVAEGGGAEAAGLKQGDIIISLEGKEVASMSKLNQILVQYQAGDKVELRIIRNMEEISVSVTLTDGKVLESN